MTHKPRATAMDISELEKILNDCIEKISDHSKIYRKEGLSEYLSLLFEEGSEQIPENFNYVKRFDNDIKILSGAFMDESEINRLKVTDITLSYLHKQAALQSKLIYIISAIHSKLCRHGEESEDVRKQFLIIVTVVMTQFGAEIHHFNKDISEVLIQLLTDRAPENLIAACECAASFFTFLKTRSENVPDFLKLLKRVSFHQRFKVRKAALKALGECFRPSQQCFL